MAGTGDWVTETDRGRVRGLVRDGVASFRGVPYAASPVGELRLAPPRRHPGWTGVREVVSAGPAVPQGPSRLERVMGRRAPDWDEGGCLTVNVHAPAGALEADELRPVLLWWHGGGFSSGSGGWDWYDGARLAALGGIVVVTANYRLGPLGYPYLPEADAVNLGARDQAAVLRWVRDNIALFGGDPRRVTVGGQSAGAYSALALALDPGTAGMVRQVLLQSGPFGLPPQDPEQAAEVTAAYLRILGVREGADPVKALRAQPVEHLLSAYARLVGRLARPGDATPPMYPVLGGPGIPDDLLAAVARGGLGDRPLLIGTTRDEATAFTAFDPGLRGLTADGAVESLEPPYGARAREVYQRYAGPRPGATPAQVLTAVRTDGLFRTGSLRVADHHAAAGNAVYAYRFDRRPADDAYGLGATHCGELPFLFGTFDAYPDSPMLGTPTEADRVLGRAFAAAVAEFVTTGAVGDWRPYEPDGTFVRHFG
ncbi:carboxylesterase family protein [Streptomyces sp. NPDC001941]|uniref:carboxylesterase/lipase family protein n=1 Tax=Streptomyces sp. NPDC001941 TaxID=3154659 RepID=UPI003329F49F